MISYGDTHYHDETLCIDEFEKMKSAIIWRVIVTTFLLPDIFVLYTNH